MAGYGRRALPDKQGLRRQHTTFDLIGSRQRNRAGKASACQRALGVDGGLGSGVRQSGVRQALVRGVA
jgi:hypothetical protein